MMIQWILTVPVTDKYVRIIDAPAAKQKMQYTTVTPTSDNYVLTELSH